MRVFCFILLAAGLACAEPEPFGLTTEALQARADAPAEGPAPGQAPVPAPGQAPAPVPAPAPAPVPGPVDPLDPWVPACQAAPNGTGVGCFAGSLVICTANGPDLSPCTEPQYCAANGSRGLPGDLIDGYFSCQNRLCEPDSYCSFDVNTGDQGAHHCTVLEDGIPSWQSTYCRTGEICDVDEEEGAVCVPESCDPDVYPLQCAGSFTYHYCDRATQQVKVETCAEGSACGRRGIPVTYGCFPEGAVDCSLVANHDASWCSDNDTVLNYCDNGEKKQVFCLADYDLSCQRNFVFTSDAVGTRNWMCR